jgi:hypothetical protein
MQMQRSFLPLDRKSSLRQVVTHNPRDPRHYAEKQRLPYKIYLGPGLASGRRHSGTLQ